jgi:hypothetical protein
MRTRSLPVALACPCLIACSAVGETPQELDAAPARSVPPARESITIGIDWNDRRGEAGDPVEDAQGWSLWVSKDLFEGVLRPALEVGAGYSEHDVDGFDSARLEVYRLAAGGKLTLEPEGLGFALYGRMGWFYRWSWDPDFEHEPFDQDGGGYYCGCGLDLLLDAHLRAGPFLDYYKGRSQDELEEYQWGICLSFTN